jgi:hypothetical protein
MTNRITASVTFLAALSMFVFAGCQEPAYGPGTDDAPSLEEHLEQPNDATPISNSLQTDQGDAAAAEETSAESDEEPGLSLDMNVDVGEDGVDVEVGKNGVDVNVGEEGVEVQVGDENTEEGQPSP